MSDANAFMIKHREMVGCMARTALDDGVAIALWRLEFGGGKTTAFPMLVVVPDTKLLELLANGEDMGTGYTLGRIEDGREVRVYPVPESETP